MSQYRKMKKINVPPCMLEESKRWGLNSKKKSLHIRSSNPLIEWEGSVHAPEIHFVPEINFGIWNKPDIMVISSSVQVYSFSTKRERLHAISWFNSRLQTVILWHGHLTYSLFFCQTQQGWAALFWEYEFDGWVAWTLEIREVLFVSVWMLFHVFWHWHCLNPHDRAKIIASKSYQLLGNPQIFFQFNL